MALLATSCGRRIDPRDRQRDDQPAPHVSGSATIPAASARDGLPSTRPVVPEGDDSLVRVDAEGLFSAVRSLHQKGVVLNVWATWCGPCRDELPMLAKVNQAYSGRGVTVLPLSMDDEESVDKVAGVLRELGFVPPYYVAKPPISELKAALHSEWPGNIPVTFLLDGAAKRRYFFNTEVYEEELRPKLDALLNGTLAEGETSHGLIPGVTL